jgi:hypothetical protein
MTLIFRLEQHGLTLIAIAMKLPAYHHVKVTHFIDRRKLFHFNVNFSRCYSHQFPG